MAVLFASINSVGIHNFGNTCYLNTLVQIVFWFVPIRNRLIEYELSKEDMDKIPSVSSNELRATM
jgi:ubiquitin C-terminal hydrolase